MRKIIFFFCILTLNESFGYISEDNLKQCGFPLKATAVFEPISYTCNPGEFLPADTTGCVMCPDGFTCSGGTFYFNETENQGLTISSTIITNNITNTCSSNIGHVMFAMFEPINITLNFNDNNGNISTTTCTYGDLIDLPNEPSRPGYIFKGWTLQTNND